ncbi:hypothetical protein ACFOKF_25485 [Sphingobium rhizovicinum]|uniref:MFS transporter n=1 Tax=Sphingobium rhizovicinum TaxID=432308 RepID=A0ABV7NP17_9SPHN
MLPGRAGFRPADPPHRIRQYRPKAADRRGLLLASTIVAANYVTSNTLVIAIMSIALFGQGMVNLGLDADFRRGAAPICRPDGGVFNLCANLAGIVTPIVVGVIVGQTGLFYGALAFIGVLALIGAAAMSSSWGMFAGWRWIEGPSTHRCK